MSSGLVQFWNSLSTATNFFKNSLVLEGDFNWFGLALNYFINFNPLFQHWFGTRVLIWSSGSCQCSCLVLHYFFKIHKSLDTYLQHPGPIKKKLLISVFIGYLLSVKKNSARYKFFKGMQLNLILGTILGVGVKMFGIAKYSS